MNDALTVCEVEVYSERRGTLFVDTYDNKGYNDSIVMIHSYIEYDTCTCMSSLK